MSIPSRGFHVLLQSYNYFLRRCFYILDDNTIVQSRAVRCGGLAPSGLYDAPILCFAQRWNPVKGLFALNGRIYFFCGTKLIDVTDPEVSAVVQRVGWMKHRFCLESGEGILLSMTFISGGNLNSDLPDGPFYCEVAHWLSSQQLKQSFIDYWNGSSIRRPDRSA